MQSGLAGEQRTDGTGSMICGVTGVGWAFIASIFGKWAYGAPCTGRPPVPCVGVGDGLGVGDSDGVGLGVAVAEGDGLGPGS
jgi:hypothetical protein